jgi:hypothetical protein
VQSTVHSYLVLSKAVSIHRDRLVNKWHQRRAICPSYEAGHCSASVWYKMYVPYTLSYTDKQNRRLELLTRFDNHCELYVGNVFLAPYGGNILKGNKKIILYNQLVRNPRCVLNSPSLPSQRVFAVTLDSRFCTLIYGDVSLRGSFQCQN